MRGARRALLRMGAGYCLRPDRKPTRELGNYRASLRPLKALYGDTLAKEFGPRALKAVREDLIATSPSPQQRRVRNVILIAHDDEPSLPI